MIDFRYLYYLTRIDGLGPVRIKRLLDKFGSAENIFNSAASELARVENISIKLADSVLRAEKDFIDYTIDYEAIITKLEKHKAEVITYEDTKYPRLLKKTYDPPVILYCRGTPENFDFEPSVSIVGTRQPSDYGKKTAEAFARELSNLGFNIVSGFARGIDTFVHRAVLEGSGRGKTTAVFGCGVDIIYPPENKKLFAEMCEKGAIISEYELSAIPDAVNFPKRNRIISGLSYGTVIVESGISGGAMITARFALDQSREVFAVPGFITSKNSEGPNMLIKSGQAKLVEGVEDIIEEIAGELEGIKLNGSKPGVNMELPLLNGNEKIIFDVIAGEKEAVHIDYVSESSGLSVSDCLVALLNLEFKGLMEQLPGKRFRVSCT